LCPKCGKENLPTSKFCQKCGTSLAPAPSPQPETKQKQYSEPGRDAAMQEKEKARLRRSSKASNYVGIGLAIIAAIVFIFFAIGGGAKDLNNQGKTPVQSTTTTKTSTTTTTGKTLSDMLGLSSNIVSIKYDVLVSGPGIPAMTMKAWLKSNRMRTEMTQQGTNVVTLIDNDAKTMYAYMPAQNLAMKIPFDPAQVPKAPTGDAESILNSNARIVGTETIDGKVCSVVEYTSGQDSVKTWIWQDKGLPIRIETTSSTGKTTIEYKNIDFSDIPDSMFELPAGVTIM